MTPLHIMERDLEKARVKCVDGIDLALTTLRGSVEFRNAVEDLLKDTPYGIASTGYDFEGLYGRLRQALRDGGIIK